VVEANHDRNGEMKKYKENDPYAPAEALSLGEKPAETS